MTGNVPPLIVFCGPPCSGKTTLAAKLHAETGLPDLAIDSILRRILPESSFGETDRNLAYRVLGLTVEVLLAAGKGVIVDGTFGRAPHLQDLEAVAANFRTPVVLVECRTDVDLALKRFRSRGGRHPAVDLDEERVERLNRSYPYRFKGLVLDTSRSVDECLTEIRRHIGLIDS